MRAEERPGGDAHDTFAPDEGRGPGTRATAVAAPQVVAPAAAAEVEVIDPFVSLAAVIAPRRAPLSAIGLLGAWLLLSAGLCYLIATQLPGKPIPLAAAAVILGGLGALLGFAVSAERRAADRRLDAELRKASNMLHSIEVVTDPGLAFLDLDELLAAVLARTKDAVGGDVVCVMLGNEDGSILRVRASTGATQFAPASGVVRAGEGVLGTVAQLARSAVVADVRAGGVGPLPDWQVGIASLMAAPLIVHGAALGIVEVASVRQRSFDAADLRLLQVVADRLGALVERARLDDVARRSRFGADHANMHLRILARGTTVLGKALETYDAALDDLADVVVSEFADWFGVHVLEESGTFRRVVSRTRPSAFGGREFDGGAHPHSRGDDLAREVMTACRPQFLVPTSRLDSEALGATIHTPETLGESPDVSSLLVVPVRVRGTCMATLSFVTGPVQRGFRPSDLETARELADRVGVTIERVFSWRASEGRVVVAANRFLAHLEARRYSPATVRAYAFDLLNFERFDDRHLDLADDRPTDLNGWLKIFSTVARWCPHRGPCLLPFQPAGTSPLPVAFGTAVGGSETVSDLCPVRKDVNMRRLFCS